MQCLGLNKRIPRVTSQSKATLTVKEGGNSPPSGLVLVRCCVLARMIPLPQKSEQIKQRGEQVGNDIQRCAGLVEQSCNRAEQIAEQVAWARLCRDIDHDLIDVHNESQ